MRIKFDAMMSHDITYVGIIQTARASGLERFPLPYAMTNCHNSLCAVGAPSTRTTTSLDSLPQEIRWHLCAHQLAVIHQYAVRPW
jgi:aconitate hydratase